MRIAASNPDNIGDFVLRQPMYTALLRAGHDLLLVVRGLVAPLAAELFPEARVVTCSGNPYERGFTSGDCLGEVLRFSPDLFVVAPFQHTQLEEQLAAALRGVPCVGFKGLLYQVRPDVTEVSSLRFARQVAPSLQMSELKKNNLLCDAVLGDHVELGPPEIQATKHGLEKAERLLEGAGLKGELFWAVCAGDAEFKSVKNWAPESWAEFCRRMVVDFGARLLFVGSTDEHASTLAIQEAMGDAGLRCVAATGEPMELATLTGVLALASGYAGKDTGPMHLAAALGKPVLAPFGGGHWPRFVPAAKRGAAITVNVPCAGCNWVCPLSRSYCVKDIPVEVMLEKAGALFRGELDRFDVEVLEPEQAFHPFLLRELVESVKTEHRKILADRWTLQQQHDDMLREVAQMRRQVADLEREKDESGRHTGISAPIRTWLDDMAKQIRMPEGVDDTVRLHLVQQRVQEVLDMNERTRALAERVSTLEFENRMKAARRVEALSSENGVTTRTEVVTEEVAALREQVEAQTEREATLRAELDTNSSRLEGQLADQAQLLRRRTAELESALALIPDLRDELARVGAELVSRDEGIASLEDSLREQAAETDILRGQLEQQRRDVEAIEADRAERLALLHRLTDEIATIEADRAERLAVIHGLMDENAAIKASSAEHSTRVNELTDKVAALETVRTQQLAQIHRLTDEIATIGVDRAERVAQIERLTEKVTRVEVDRAERLVQINRLTDGIAMVEADRAERLTQIHRLTEAIATIEADRAERLTQIHRLTEEIATIQADRADRGKQIEELHNVIAGLRNEVASLHNLPPVRLLKKLHLL